MRKKGVIIGLCLTIAFQVLFLFAEYGNAVHPLWTGRKILLKTIPVDPRSLFRGNYARLNYEISNVPAQDIETGRQLRNGEIVYVKLKPGADGIYTYNGAGLVRPVDGIFLRGRVQRHRWGGGADTYRIRYGIEAFFAPKEKAIELEKALRKNGIAEIMVAGNGKATLKNVRGE